MWYTVGCLSVSVNAVLLCYWVTHAARWIIQFRRRDKCSSVAHPFEWYFFTPRTLLFVAMGGLVATLSHISLLATNTQLSNTACTSLSLATMIGSLIVLAGLQLRPLIVVVDTVRGSFSHNRCVHSQTVAVLLLFSVLGSVVVLGALESVSNKTSSGTALTDLPGYCGWVHLDNTPESRFGLSSAIVSLVAIGSMLASSLYLAHARWQSSTTMYPRVYRSRVAQWAHSSVPQEFTSIFVWANVVFMTTVSLAVVVVFTMWANDDDSPVRERVLIISAYARPHGVLVLMSTVVLVVATVLFVMVPVLGSISAAHKIIQKTTTTNTHVVPKELAYTGRWEETHWDTERRSTMATKNCHVTGRAFGKGPPSLPEHPALSVS
jgi:hypothetical protein